MEIIIKHPTNPIIDIVLKLDGCFAANTTIESLLKNVEDIFIRINQVNPDYDYVKYWKLRHCKTGRYIDKNSMCSEIESDNNEFTVCWEL